MHPAPASDSSVEYHAEGSQSPQLIAESLEVAPFSNQLYSSDAWGPSELHLLGALLWRRGITRVVGQWVRDGDWSARAAERVLPLIGHETARRVYRLCPPADPPP